MKRLVGAASIKPSFLVISVLLLIFFTKNGKLLFGNLTALKLQGPLDNKEQIQSDRG